MREQHPIDELFARALRDAEADPPPQAFAGIARERLHRRTGWLRRWGWLPLLLLLGTGIGYTTVAHRAAPGDTKTIAAAQQLPQSRSTNDQPENGSAPEAIAPPAPAHKDHPVFTIDQGIPDHRDKAQVQVDLVADASHPAVASSAASVTASLHGIGIADNVRSGHAYAGDTRSTRDEKIGHEPMEGLTSGAKVLNTLSTSPAAPLETTVDKEGSIRTFRLPFRLAQVGDDPAAPELRSGTLLQFKAPKRTWWVAATAGQFMENRTWKGGDVDLREALQGTEHAHSITAVGVLVGVNSPGKWSVATGVEYHAGRYDFQHADRFSTRRDSIVNYVVTFNSLVLESYSDTITTYTEEQRTVAAVNRYTTLRVPLELGWHTAHRRFRLGARAGLALELSTLRSGATLRHNGQGMPSVEVQSVGKQCMSVLGGSFGADFGYMLTEHWSIWASPVVEAGLLSLFPAETGPYALPERMGVRCRLAYTIRP